jgi:predicted peptidase
MVLKACPDAPFVIVAPQLHSELEGWTSEQLDLLLDDVLAKYSVDPDRVYVAGASWGAYGVWDWGCHSPQRLAAIVPISGEPNTDLVDQMKTLPVWAFHGALDKAVWPHEDQAMIAALQKLGDEAKLTMYPDLAHNAWSRALADPEVYRWMLSHRRHGS